MCVLGWITQNSGIDHLCRSLSCLPQTDFCTLPWASESPFFLPSWLFCQWWGFPGCRNFSSPSGSFQGQRSHLISFLFLFILSSYMEIFIVLLDVWGLLLVISKSSVRIVANVHVFLMYLWEWMSSVPCYSFILIGAFILVGSEIWTTPLIWL